MPSLYGAEYFRDDCAKYLRECKILECQKRRAKSGKAAEEPISDAGLDEISGPVLKIMKLEVTEEDWRRYPETSWRS